MAQQYGAPPPGQYATPPPGQPQYATPPPQVHHSSPAPVPQPSYAPHPAPQGAAGGAPVPWSNDFWDCFSPSELCCMAYWCPCIVFGKNAHRLKEPSLATYSPVNLHCVGWCALAHCGFWWIIQMLQRSEVRAKYNLAGSGVGDCCRPYCCACCELMQEEKELLLRTSSSAQAPGYQKPEGGMNYAPQPH